MNAILPISNRLPRAVIAAPVGRAVYVSSSRGRNASDGASPDAAVASLGRARWLLRQGYADRLLLRRGDIFSGSLGTFRLAGRSQDRPVVIGAYGDGARPRVVCESDALRLDEPRYVQITGLHLIAAGRECDSAGGAEGAGRIRGICIRGRCEDVRLHDCRIELFDQNISLEGASNVTISRCVIVDAWAGAGGEARGVSGAGCESVRIEGCVFDHNGTPGRGDGSTHAHVAFSPACAGISVLDCIIARSPGHGALLGGGGEVRGNLLIGNAFQCALAGTSGTVRGNLLLGGRDNTRDARPGHGVVIACADSRVEENVIAHRYRVRGAAIVLARGPLQGAAARVVRVASNLLYACGGGIEVASGWDEVHWIGNDLQAGGRFERLVWLRARPGQFVAQDNRYHSDEPDIRRLLRLRDESLSPDEWAAATGDDSIWAAAQFPFPTRRLPKRFIADARAQADPDWREHLAPSTVIQRVREGFGRPPVAM